MAGSGDHAHALGYLGVAVQKLEARPREVEPLRGYRLLLSRARQLRALDVERGVFEDRVLTAVVEVEVAVDHDLHVRRAEVVLGERIGGVTVDDLPLLDELGRPTDPGVDEDRARPRMLDHESVHRDLVECIEPSQVEANYLHGVKEGTGRR